VEIARDYRLDERILEPGIHPIWGCGTGRWHFAPIPGSNATLGRAAQRDRHPAARRRTSSRARAASAPGESMGLWSHRSPGDQWPSFTCTRPSSLPETSTPPGRGVAVALRSDPEVGVSIPGLAAKSSVRCAPQDRNEFRFRNGLVEPVIARDFHVDAPVEAACVIVWRDVLQLGAIASPLADCEVNASGSCRLNSQLCHKAVGIFRHDAQRSGARLVDVRFQRCWRYCASSSVKTLISFGAGNAALAQEGEYQEQRRRRRASNRRRV